MTAAIESSVDTALAYYQAMNSKDLAKMERCLHPDIHIHLVTPMENLTGKQAVLGAAQRLLPAIKSIEVRASFGSEAQAILVYDMGFNEPFGVCRTAALMTIKDGLIMRNELFFDARPFDQK
jgi:ketosteroid isomerase-like protein